MTRQKRTVAFWVGAITLGFLIAGCAGHAHKTEDKKAVQERADQSQKALEQEETNKQQ